MPMLMGPRFGVAACVFASMAGSAAAVELVKELDGVDMDDDDECQAGTEEERQECAFSAIQLRGVKAQAAEETEVEAGANETEGATCGPLWWPKNLNCASTVKWAAGGGKNDPKASSWFHDMNSVAGVDFKQATVEDFQRLYFCAPPGGKSCGTPPCKCSKPPCDKCLANQRHASEFKACRDNPGTIACKPPKKALDYSGATWPTIKVEGTQEMHIFAIGDWGGMDGTLNPIEGRPPLVAYSSGSKPGPSVFPRTRWDRHHKVELCNHKQFIACYNSDGQGSECPDTCGFVKGIDDQPQMLVASAMRTRAATADPAVVLNVGDNFYWGGIEKNCGTPMDEISFTAKHQYDQIFEHVYQGAGLSGKPWLSVLGNHDWGGRVFNNGWDQQIAYTWASDRWVMPAPYFMTTVDFVDQGFTMDVFMMDTNFNDAKEPSQDPEHNLCGIKHNPVGANCHAAGGPMNVVMCPGWFARLWQEQKVWITQKLSESKADWQVIVTHFPCGEDGANQAFYRKLHTAYGLDLLVTGHRHDQELWTPEMTYKNHMGGLTCFVTGGGGGISSEATPDPEHKEDWYGEGQYGFYDLTVTKSSITIESINYDGEVWETATVYPK